LTFPKKKRYPYCEIDNRAIKARPKNSLRARRINRESPCLIGKENDKGKAELSFRLLRGTDPHRNITPLVFPVLSRSAMTTRHRIRQETATCLTSSHGHGLMDRPAEGRKRILKRKQASACTRTRLRRVKHDTDGGYQSEARPCPLSNILKQQRHKSKHPLAPRRLL